MEDINKINDIKNLLLNSIEEYKDGTSDIHPYDLAKELEKLRDLDDKEYEYVCKRIPSDLFAEILCEMPSYIQEEIAEVISDKKIATITSKMDSDDASELIYNISQKDEEIAQTILSKLDDEDKQIIEKLNSYDDHEAGSYMQSELFSATLDEDIGTAIKRLKSLKEEELLDNIFHVFLIDKDKKLIGAVGLEELILFDRQQHFREIPQDKLINYSCNHKSDISDAVEMFTHYNLSALAVVDEENRLLGRITHDDIHDVIQDQDTKQLYSLAGVNDDAENEESVYLIGRKRAIWLGINLVTAILASIVIGFFDTTIQSLVALAVLMPIVASMGGNAGTQTLTVTVRQMALGEISYQDAKKTINKEVIISLVNGLIFAFIIGIIAFIWFKIPLLGLVIALSMVINLLSAGFFGAVIPILLEKFEIDPAIGSTVILTTVTDVVGFFSFLGLATLILL
ncbi:magnesium transporter [Halarcobacter ebronensis]|uniref:Magnesium transporter MgtE n=1 Tax=Halarcobacter ebronensis TaxID=1462615 RepID=A0A4Q1AFX9_9BACT|nr:magnesium transporter [Halarcobacter ebronensis]QKF81468.1 magnesium/cobalt/nickel transporter, MgtE family [Halarcobacter ebronensis]RXK02470.1 magnesium transporter [Halarcobacter ebronensis]